MFKTLYERLIMSLPSTILDTRKSHPLTTLYPISTQFISITQDIERRPTTILLWGKSSKFMEAL